jgi:hypothetical protein
MAGQDFNTLFCAKYFGLSDNQLFDTPPGISNIVRYASGAVRYVQALFKDPDIKIRQIALGTAGRAHAGGISADNNKIHGSLPGFQYADVFKLSASDGHLDF